MGATDPLIAALERLADPTMLHKHRDPKHPDLGGEVLVRCALAADALAQHAAKAGDGGDWVLIPRELQYAQDLAAYAAKKLDCVPEWKPLDDMMGVLSQIDNALTGLVAAPSPPTPSASGLVPKDTTEAILAELRAARELKAMVDRACPPPLMERVSPPAPPAQGSIVASCGHTLGRGENTVSVQYDEEVCDAIEGFLPATIYAEFCPSCAKKLEADTHGKDEDLPQTPKAPDLETGRGQERPQGRVRSDGLDPGQAASEPATAVAQAPSPPAGDEVEAVVAAILPSLWSPASGPVEWTQAKIEAMEVQAASIAKAAIQALDRVRGRT